MRPLRVRSSSVLMARAPTRRCDRVGRVAAARAGLIRLARMDAIPTSLVGSYAQPDWLIDREKLRGRFPPRVRARELWRVGPGDIEEAPGDATRPAIAPPGRAGPDAVTHAGKRPQGFSQPFATAPAGGDIDH